MVELVISHRIVGCRGLEVKVARCMGKGVAITVFNKKFSWPSRLEEMSEKVLRTVVKYEKC